MLQEYGQDKKRERFTDKTLTIVAQDDGKQPIKIILTGNEFVISGHENYLQIEIEGLEEYFYLRVLGAE